MTPGLYNQSYNIVSLTEKRKGGPARFFSNWKFWVLMAPTMVTVKIVIEQLIMLRR